MQCKSCNTELPKKAKVCPRCGALVDDRATANLKILAIVGIVIAMLGSMLPFVQNTGTVSDAYSFMNIDISALWYIYLLLLVGSILLVVAKREKLSIITTSLSGILFIVSFVAVKFRGYTGRNKYSVYSLTDLLSNGNGEDKFVVGCGLFVIIIGIAIAIAGCFIDIMKYFKKDLAVDKRFLSNSINRSIWTKIYYHRGFYVMFLPVFIMVILFFYWPMLGCRFAFTKYVIRAPYYVGLYHFNRMFTNDVYFWRAFRNTLVLSLTKLILPPNILISLLAIINPNLILSILFSAVCSNFIKSSNFLSKFSTVIA